ncbi:dipicolinate synthase subunit A [Ureibacillus sp. FSL K6-0786]|uniref:dipicolinate synthase subunit A n=1 Tax=Ureibacillus sp. FSL K6-0786 TaxID=2954607 RepID=UPI0030DBBADB
MTNEKWLVIGTDERLKILAKMLSNPERTVYYKSKTNWDHELNHLSLSIQPDYVVLPIQPLKVEVPAVLGITNATIFSGKTNEEWKEILNENQIYYYLEDEEFIWQNALLTAEAFVATFYNTKHAISGKRFIITGFGRVAKTLGHLLRCIGAEVVIAVRSDVQLNEAKAFRFESVYLADVGEIEADYFINTIPARWLDASVKEKINMPIYDLASYPGCLKDDVERDHYELLPALPGKYFPHDAAKILYNSIVGQLRRRKSC